MNWKAVKIYAAVIVGFTIIALVYFPQVLSGKGLMPHDIMQYRGGAQEITEFRAVDGGESYWSNSMFGGMPTYQMGAEYKGYWIQYVDAALRFLPNPSDYWFLALSGFFILGMVLFKRWPYALLGSVLFAFATYFFIIIGAGHYAKMHAIVYLAPLMAGIILLFRGEYRVGFVLTTLFGALELYSGHPQITYYFAFGILIFGALKLAQAMRQKEIKTFVLASLLGLFSAVLAIGMNAPKYLTTYEYAPYTTRGGSELKPQQKGLDKDYITQWSYGIAETINLWIPNFMGGGSQTPAEYKPKVKEAIIGMGQPESVAMQYAESIPTYWGDQPGTSGPAYQGAVVVFLFLVGIFLVRGYYKWWLLLSTILSFMMAWGKNFPVFTNFMIEYMPGYDKFRAVSMALVLAEFTMPLLGVMAVYAYFEDKTLTDKYKRYVILGVAGFLSFTAFVFLGFSDDLFNLKSPYDEALKLPEWLKSAIIEDRLGMIKQDTWRTLSITWLVVLVWMAFDFGKLKNKWVVIGLMGVLSLADMWMVGKRHLNAEQFVPSDLVDNPFPTAPDMALMAENAAERKHYEQASMHKTLLDIKNADKTHYRVLNMVLSPFNEASTSYFHQSMGGYHGAKLSHFQDLVDVYFTKSTPSPSIINMMNVKYVVMPHDSLGIYVQQNANALGNAWLVQTVKKVPNAKAEMDALATLDANTQLVSRTLSNKSQANPSQGSIRLTSYAPNRLEYAFESQNPETAIFSEIYYPKGWLATIDGKETPIHRANYVLRAIEIPQGKHKVVFEFKPTIVQTAFWVGLLAYGLFIVVILVFVYRWKFKP